MIIKCKNCSAALLFDAALGQMHCSHCDSTYSIDDVNVPLSEQNMMECDIYVCTSCGAKLAINNTESACFCGYCGQPTIVFERVAEFKKPDKIIPFKLTQAQATELMHTKFNKGFFIPKSFKNAGIERVMPIYVPFFIYDIDYHDKMIDALHSLSDNQQHYREVMVHYKNMPLDAALNLNDDTSSKLEPYQMDGLTDFNEAYLSGFYADCFDEAPDITDVKAFKRCKKLYDDELNNKITKEAKVASGKPDYTIIRRTYALLPAYFMTLKHKKHKYTILINGQTGKMICGVPQTRLKVFLIGTLLSIILGSVFAFLNHQAFCLLEGSQPFIWFLAIVGVVAGAVCITASAIYDKFLDNRDSTRSSKLINYAVDRQTGEN